MEPDARLLNSALCLFYSGKPTCLVNDPVNKHIAIGFDNGKVSVICNKSQIVKRLSHDDFCESVKLISFWSYRGKSFLATTLKDNPTVFLWDFENQTMFQSIPVDEWITALIWSPTSKCFYVGTKVGSVTIVKMTEEKKDGFPIFVPSIEQPKNLSSESDGEVVLLEENQKHSEVLVSCSNGWTGRWNLKENEISKLGINKQEPIACWCSESKDAYSLSVAYGNGRIRGYKLRDKNVLSMLSLPLANFSFNGDNHKVAVTKLQRVKFTTINNEDTWLIFCGGCSSVTDPANVISIYFGGSDKFTSLVPFKSRIIDFTCLPSDEDPSILVVLTESELIRLRLTQPSKEIIDNPLKFERSYTSLQVTSPVTSLQYCRMCSTENFLKQELTAATMSYHLIVTGHLDGSLRLWICEFSNESPKTRMNKMGLVISTTHYLDFSPKEKQLPAEQEEQELAIDPQQLSLVKLVGNHLLAVNKIGHVLLFQLQSKESGKPQSQEVILKDDSDANAILCKTPPPHFCPNDQSDSDVKVLQHFSCHYQSGHDRPLEQVAVNCVDYNEQMKMLSVGTDKGLIVLDVHTNNLIQVIGSEEKLLNLSGRSGRLTSKDASSVICNVTCVETTLLTFKKKQNARVTLWAGTAGGTLGLLKVTRENDKEPLKLEKTDEGRKKDSSIVKIQFHVQLETAVAQPEAPVQESTMNEFELINAMDPHISVEMDTSNAPATNHSAESTLPGTVYAVVTTADRVKCYIFHGERKDVKTLDFTTFPLKTEIVTIDGKPYLIGLLMSGKIDIFRLQPDLKKLNNEPADFGLKLSPQAEALGAETLFSGGSSHFVLECPDQLIKVAAIKMAPLTTSV